MAGRRIKVHLEAMGMAPNSSLRIAATGFVYLVSYLHILLEGDLIRGRIVCMYPRNAAKLLLWGKQSVCGHAVLARHGISAAARSLGGTVSSLLNRDR
jgi:hypothetical protein